MSGPSAHRSLVVCQQEDGGEGGGGGVILADENFIQCCTLSTVDIIWNWCQKVILYWILMLSPDWLDVLVLFLLRVKLLCLQWRHKASCVVQVFMLLINHDVVKTSDLGNFFTSAFSRLVLGGSTANTGTGGSQLISSSDHRQEQTTLFT